jgi:2-iminoacetate synthase
MTNYEERMNFTEFKYLIADDSDAHLERLAREAKRVRTERFGNAIKIYAPLYISNECINGCVYCGFNHKSPIERRTLTVDEATRETQALLDAGHRHILLVTGEHPKAAPIELLCDVAREIRKKAASVSIEGKPCSLKEYRKLAEAGIDGVTLYQETYDRKAYSAMHPSGPKKDYDNRLRAIDAAGEAGMRFLGIGALLGLDDWRSEACALFEHAHRLMKTHWKSSLTISVPRIRSQGIDFTPPRPVDDRSLTLMICALKIALPNCGVILSTREPAKLRDNLLPLGITQMSAGSVTKPGGYTMRDDSGKQFSIEDTRTAAQVAERLRRAGFDPVFKDWENVLYG